MLLNVKLVALRRPVVHSSPVDLLGALLFIKTLSLLYKWIQKG